MPPTTIRELFAGQEHADIVTLRGDDVAAFCTLLPSVAAQEPALRTATAIHGAHIRRALELPGTYFGMGGGKIWTYEQ